MASSHGGMDLWEDRQAGQVNTLEVSLQREQQAVCSQASRLQSLENRCQRFLEYQWEDQDAPSIIQTPEGLDLRHWYRLQSWSYCAKCSKLSRRKLLPSPRKRSTPSLETACKCGAGVDAVPSIDDVPLLLRGLTQADIRVLRPLDIHCGSQDGSWLRPENRPISPQLVSPVRAGEAGRRGGPTEKEEACPCV